MLALRLYTLTKWNTVDISKDGDVPLRLKPNGPTSIGVGINYKSLGLNLGFGIPRSAESNRIYGKTNRFDVQMGLYPEKYAFDGYAQIYRGYYNVNPEDFTDWTADVKPQLRDMKVFSVGLNALYVFNNRHFSYKAAFVRNQIQKKSAGSFILGVFGQMDLVRTDDGFIPGEFPDSLRQSFDLKSYNTIAIGVSVGYIYTWVISKNVFFNIGLTPGFGNQRVQIEATDGSKSVNNSAAAQLSGRSAVGVELKHFYFGVTGSLVWRNFKYKGYDLGLSTEQIRVFVGKRFNTSKSKK